MARPLSEEKDEYVNIPQLESAGRDKAESSGLLTNSPKSATSNGRKKFVRAAALTFLTFFLVFSYRPACHHIQKWRIPNERPESQSMCDYYTRKNYVSNSATTQKKLVSALVDNMFTGQWTEDGKPYRNVLAGILHYDGESGHANCLRWLDGSLNSTNRDGKATSVNFLTGKTFNHKGVVDLPEGNEEFVKMKESMSRYFAPILGCSDFGRTTERYNGKSMAEAHKFMDLTTGDMLYFITQVPYAAMQLGFSVRDSALLWDFFSDTFYPLDLGSGMEEAKTVWWSNYRIKDTTTPPTFEPKEFKEKPLEISSKMIHHGCKKEPTPVQKRHHHVHAKRQDFSSAPPPLTMTNIPSNIANATDAASTSGTSGQSVTSHLGLALGVGIGAGLGIIIIAAVIAYLVIRKKRIARRQSMSMGLKAPNDSGIEMQRGDSARRVDRSEHGNVVGKPKRKKNVSVDERSVRFSTVPS